jgi:beta-carotene hydroxylase
VSQTAKADVTSTAPTNGAGKTIAPIRADRSWIGAPAGTILNPTMALAAATVVLFAGGVSGYAFGASPIWVTIALNTVAIYLGFTVMHEAMHGVAHHNRRVNAALGRPSAFLLLLSFPLFRAAHYEHHSHTNDPSRDPDYLVARGPTWMLPLLCLSLPLEYRRHYYGRRLWRKPSELAEVVIVDALLIGTFVALSFAGLLTAVLVVWIAPVLLALLFLALTFDYFPHAPYDSTERYLDTRIYPSRVLQLLLLGQNYHLIHHLWTTIPWYRYQRVFEQIRPQLEERDARIGWRITNLPESHDSPLLGTQDLAT